MKKLWIAAICAAASLTLTACGKSACERFGQAKVDLSQKGCVKVDRIPDPQAVVFEQNCDLAWEGANEDQRNAFEDELEAYTECVDNVSQCNDEAQQASFEETAATCTEPTALPPFTQVEEEEAGA